MAERNGAMKRREDILVRFGTRIRELQMQTGLSREAGRTTHFAISATQPQ
jgi:hypothetical protein